MEENMLDVFLGAIKLERKELTDSNISILEDAQHLGYFDDPDLLTYNRDTANVLVRIAQNGVPHKVLYDMASAFINETTMGLCLDFEWFTEMGNLNTVLLVDGKPDGEKIMAAWNASHTGKFSPFDVFKPEHSDFLDKRFSDFYRNYLSNLYHYAGLEEVFLERFFESGFQETRILISDFINPLQSNDFSGFGERFLDTYGEDVLDAIQLKSVDDVDQLLISRPKLFSSFALKFLESLAALRKCTAGMAGIFLELINHNPAARLMGNPTVELNGFELLRQLVRNLLVDGAVGLDKRRRSALQLFADGTVAATAKTGGFISIISRQQSFFSELEDKSSLVFTVKNGSELEKVVGERNQLMDDLASLHRMCFLLSNRALFAENEQVLLVDKLATILTSASSNYYADIFELYFAILLKKYRVELTLLSSQRRKGQEVSTCDYRFGANVAADCKCMITHDAKLKGIAKWCQKVASQVKSTFGYQGVEFGGAVIACRDRDFEFLKAFRDFSGLDKFNVVERGLLAQALMEIYAEFKRHSGSEQHQVKFIAFYYLPPVAIGVEEATGLKPDSTTTRKEIFVVMTTKYASDEQVEQISEIFRPVCNFIFKFNNAL